MWCHTVLSVGVLLAVCSAASTTLDTGEENDEQSANVPVGSVIHDISGVVKENAGVGSEITNAEESARTSVPNVPLLNDTQNSRKDPNDTQSLGNNLKASANNILFDKGEAIEEPAEPKPDGTINAKPSLSKKVLSLTGNSFLAHEVIQEVQAPSVTSISLTFRARLKDNILMYAESISSSSGFVSLMIDTSGSLLLTTSIGKQNKLSEINAIEIEEDGSGILDPFDDTERDVESEETAVEDPNGIAVSHPNVVDGSWHTVNISWSHTRPGAYFTVSLDGRLSEHDIDLYSSFYPRRYWFGYIPTLDEDCNTIEMCPRRIAATNVKKYEYSVTDQRCYGSQSGFSSHSHCKRACQLPGVSSFNPLSGCLKYITVDGRDLLADVTGGQTAVLSVTPRDRRLEDPLNDSCPQLTTPWPAVSLPHQAAHFQIPAPCRSAFALSFSVRTFTSHRHDSSSAAAILASGNLAADTALKDTKKWKLIVKHGKLRFEVTGGNKSVSTHTHFQDNTWNYVSLSYDKRTVTISLNGLHHQLPFNRSEISFVTPFTIGDQKTGMTGCLNDFVLDGYAFDARKFINRKSGVIVGLCMERDLCLHGGEVMPGTTAWSCNCSGTAYEGTHCEFLRYPSSCSEYRQLGYIKSGPYTIDPDGEDPIPPIEVLCQFLDTSTNTSIGHNLPENFEILPEPQQSRILDISYPGGRPLLAYIKRLASTHQCGQDVRFGCRNYPLGLAASKTLLSYGDQAFINRLGQAAPGVCPCNENESCSKSHVSCNCDLNDSERRFDSVWLQDAAHLPLSSVIFGSSDGSDGDSRLWLSVGNVSCSAPVAATKAISLLHNASYAQLSVNTVSSLSFAFKTLLTDAVILEASATTTLCPSYSIQVQQGTSLVLLHDTKEIMKVVTGYPLNSGDWQHVSLDFIEGQTRLILNGGSTFADGSSAWSSSHSIFYFGRSPQRGTFDSAIIPGMIGCVRDVRINSSPIDFDVESGTEEGCKELCSLMAVPYGDRFSNGNMAEEYETICAGKILKTTFEEYLYSDKGVRFTDPEAEVLFDMTGENLLQAHVNPITQNVSFVFRTRESSALLLFAYDNAQNVLQIYLSEPTVLTVVFNDEFLLRTISVDTPGKRIDNGRPVLFRLTRAENQTSVHVFIDGRWFSSTLELQIKYILHENYKQFPYERTSYLTKIQQSKTIPEGFLSIHIGGARIGGVESPLPNLIGCVTSFAVGNETLTFDNMPNWEKKTAGGVLANCVDTNADCSNSPSVCQHGGVCLASFTEDSPHPPCDCSHTSYTGLDCTAETCYEFGKQDALQCSLPPPGSSGLSTPDFELNFAFAITKEAGLSNPRRQMLEFISENFRASVAAFNTSLVMSFADFYTFKNWTWELPPWMLRTNLLLGQRHRLYFSYQYSTVNFYFNGRAIAPTMASKISSAPEVPDGSHDAVLTLGKPEPPSPHFQGVNLCLSNVQVTVHGTTYLPLEMYVSGQCSAMDGFSLPTLADGCSKPAPPVFFGAPRFANAEHGAAVPMGDAPELVPYGNESSPGGIEPEEETGNTTTVLIIVLSVSALLLLVIIVVLVVCIKKVRRDHDKSLHPNMLITQSYRKSTSETESAVNMNIYSQNENPGIPLTERQSSISAATYSNPIRPEAGEQHPLLQGNPVETSHLGAGAASAPPMSDYSAEMFQDQIYKVISDDNEYGMAEGEMYPPENGSTVEFKGLSMGNNMLYESARRQQQQRRRQHEEQEKYEADERTFLEDRRSHQEEPHLQSPNRENAKSNVKSEDLNPYEECEYKDGQRWNGTESSAQTQNPEDFSATQSNATEQTDRYKPKISADRGSTAASIDEPSSLDASPAKEMNEGQNRILNSQQNNTEGDENSHYTTPKDDSATYAVAQKGQLVKYIGKPVEAGIVNNLVYDVATPIERGQKKLQDPRPQKESLPLTAYIDERFTEEILETARNKERLSNERDVQPELDVLVEGRSENKEHLDEPESVGTSVDKDEDDDWYSHKSLVISYSHSVEPAVQTAQIISKQPSNV